MASNVESGFYWMGFAAGMNGKSWACVPYPPGTREYHQWLEGSSDGLKARILEYHHGPAAVHHDHGQGYHAH